jgi:hypothetical protein
MQLKAGRLFADRVDLKRWSDPVVVLYGGFVGAASHSMDGWVDRSSVRVSMNAGWVVGRFADRLSAGCDRFAFARLGCIGACLRRARFLFENGRHRGHP